MTKKKKIILVDAMALIYRAHFAFIRNPRINSKGFNTSAIFGFLTSLLEILEKDNPTHIAVAFDSHEPTLRSEDFTDYKANRDKQPEDITLALPYVKKLLKAMNIPALEVPGYEADDIIATLTRKIPEDEYDIYMYTPDKDYAQLVKSNVFLYKPSRMGNPPEIWDEEKVKQEFGIEKVEQVVDIQGLTGDAVDNIPGVPGIGPKTATKLIREFGSIENLINNTSQLKGKLKETLETHKEQALMSKQLARLVTDMDIEFDEERFRRGEMDIATLEDIFAELEFRTLSKRILGHEAQGKIENNQNIETVQAFQPGQIHVLSSSEEWSNKLNEALNSSSFFAFDAEYSSDSFMKSNPVSVSFSFKPGEIYYYRLGELNKDLVPLKTIWESDSILKCCFDYKFHRNVFSQLGNNEISPVFDLKLAHYLLEAEERHTPDYLARKYLNFQYPEASLFEDKNQTLALNVSIQWPLFQIFKKELEKIELDYLYNEVEIPLSQVLSRMELTGVNLDCHVLAEYSKRLEQELQELQEEIFHYSGTRFNVNSAQQLGHVLFDILKLDPNAKRTKKSGQYSTSEDVLTKLAEKHPVVKKVLEYREIQKLKSTYVDALPQLVNEKTGRLHTTFDQTGTATGRLSSRNPNLQNIPIRTERGRIIRKAFIPSSPEYKILSADYSQIELRIIAHASEDPSMIEDFNKGLDIHTATAARVFGVKHDEVTPEMRRKAKEVNFGIIYGISSWGLAQRLGISRQEGADIKEQYFKKYPKIKEYMQQCIEKARQNGYAETILKRRRYLRDINSRNAMQRSFAERNAINAPIQGSAADLIKLAMVKIYQDLKKNNLKTQMILQVHDELVFDAHQEELEQVKQLVKYNMENAMKLRVPLVTELGMGNNWLEAH